MCLSRGRAVAYRSGTGWLCEGFYRARCYAGELSRVFRTARGGMVNAGGQCRIGPCMAAAGTYRPHRTGLASGMFADVAVRSPEGAKSVRIPRAVRCRPF